MSPEPSTPLESLLRLAGERDQPSPEAMARAREAARGSWQRALGQVVVAPAPSRSRRRLLLAMAASAAVVALAGAWFWRPEKPPEWVARVIAVQGDAGLQESAQLRSGEEVRTADGRVALAVGDALSLRVDQHTRLRLEGKGHVTLLQGGLYVDSGGLSARSALRIDTPAGAVRHVGTQYQVRVSGDHTRVQVREGRVALARKGGTVDLGAGDAVDVRGNRVRVDHGRPGHGADWEWAAATAPGFDIENRPLSEFLAWLSREHGWQLRFNDAGLQSRVHEIRLHGSMAGLDVNGMLERVVLVTGVPLESRDGVLWVGAVPR